MRVIETSEEERLVSFIATFICVLFLYIKKNRHEGSCLSFLGCYKNIIQLGCNRDSSKTDLTSSSGCPTNIFKYL